ncbi:hypothetical protein ACHAXS_014353 [Conticribra weissflogii]
MISPTLLLPLSLLAGHGHFAVQSFRLPSPLTTSSPLRSARASIPSISRSTSSFVSRSSSIGSALSALSRRQSFLLDGGELESFLLHNHNDSPQESSTTATAAAAEKVFRSPRNSPQGIGCLTFVTGTTEEQDYDVNKQGGGAAKTKARRIIGVEVTTDKANEKNDDANTEKGENNIHKFDETISLGNNIRVYKHTVATIPDGVSDWDAISTAAAAVVGVHCAVPRLGGVGGSEVEFTSGKAVVIGGNDYACFIADGLATLGIDVSVVSTGGVNVKNDRGMIMSLRESNIFL